MTGLVLAAGLGTQETRSAAAPTPVVRDCPGETPPGEEPVAFDRGVVSVEGRNTQAPKFSPVGRMPVFSRYPDGTSFRMVRGKGGWSAPEPTGFTGKEVTVDATTKRRFFYDRGDLFCVRYSDDGFAAPTPLSAKINAPEVEFYPCLTGQGNLHFSRNSNWDQGPIMEAKPDGDDFDVPVDPGDLANRGGASHGFVSPDESHLLFDSPCGASATKNDLRISFRGAVGAWLAPGNPEPRINRDALSVLCPTVSPHGEYRFLTCLQDIGTGHVYWGSTRVIEAARPPMRPTAPKNVGA